MPDALISSEHLHFCSCYLYTKNVPMSYTMVVLTKCGRLVLKLSTTDRIVLLTVASL